MPIADSKFLSLMSSANHLENENDQVMTNDSKDNSASGLLIQTVHGISYPRVGLNGISQPVSNTACVLPSVLRAKMNNEVTKGDEHASGL